MLVCVPLFAFVVFLVIREGSLGTLAFFASVVLVVQFVALAAIIRRISGAQGRTPQISSDETAAEELDEKLRLLEEAGAYFGGSLKLEDMFRLLISRVTDILPLKGAWFFQVNDDEEAGEPILFGDAGGGPGLEDLRVEAETELGLVVREIGSEAGSSIIFAMAVRRSDELLGIAGLHVDGAAIGRDEATDLAQAVRSRIEPVLAGAVSYERSAENALKDPVTGLPNERAFHLVLENRIAEARRARGEARLTVLAMDLSSFSAINRDYGHATGDRALEYAAHTLSDHLRAMDLIARTSADEFLAVLPDTGAESSENVVSRLKELNGRRFFRLPDGKGFPVILNIGAAFFAQDGKTAADLIAAARRRRNRPKQGKGNQVIQFPTKYPN